jgi:hypothetical protein
MHTDEITVPGPRSIPYDTGKVKIGLLYQPPLRDYLTHDAEMLQEALLAHRYPLAAKSMWDHILDIFWRAR